MSVEKDLQNKQKSPKKKQGPDLHMVTGNREKMLATLATLGIGAGMMAPDKNAEAAVLTFDSCNGGTALCNNELNLTLTGLQEELSGYKSAGNFTVQNPNNETISINGITSNAPIYYYSDSGITRFDDTSNPFSISMDGGGAFTNNGALDPGINISNFSSNSPTSVPVPAAVWLLGSGLAGLAAWKRKNKLGNEEVNYTGHKEKQTT